MVAVVAGAVKMRGADNNQQKAAAGVVQTAVMAAAEAEAAVAVAAATAAAMAAAAAVAKAMAVAAAEMAPMAAMTMAIAGRGQDKREVGMWFHVYQNVNLCVHGPIPLRGT
jgi:hypothetical protein